MIVTYGTLPSVLDFLPVRLPRLAVVQVLRPQQPTSLMLSLARFWTSLPLYWAVLRLLLPLPVLPRRLGRLQPSGGFSSSLVPRSPDPILTVFLQLELVERIPMQHLRDETSGSGERYRFIGVEGCGL